ncbi:TadE/TadG family type IV pilus assembly protein [Alsobacter sp. SYSU BS001988]
MKVFPRFTEDSSGAAAILFSVLVIPLLAAAGMAVDYTRASTSQTALQGITDSTALTVAASSATADQVQSAAETNANARVKPSYAFAGGLTVTATLSPDGKSVTVQTSTSVRNSIFRMFGQPTTEIRALAQAFRAVTGSIELAMVLDNTGSMAQSGKLTTLKSAATTLVDTLTSDPKADVSIGLVPFSVYVNVGLGNRNQSWISGATDSSNTYQVCTAAGCNTSSPVTRVYNCQTMTGTGSNDGVPYTYTYQQCQYEYGSPVTTCYPASCSNRTDTYKWYGCVGSRNYPLNLTDASPSVPYPALMNITCGAPLVPLTKSYSSVKSAINAMTASGETYAPAGLVWGLNMLSSDQPLGEALPYDASGANKKPRKVLVFMTDGVNTRSPTYPTHNGGSRALADQYSGTLCQTIKSQHIEIFSIALMVDDAQAKDMLQQCASGADHYFDASDSAALKSAFSQIASSLQQTYLGR